MDALTSIRPPSQIFIAVDAEKKMARFARYQLRKITTKSSLHPCLLEMFAMWKIREYLGVMRWLVREHVSKGIRERGCLLEAWLLQQFAC